jgi:hypothetical protein
MIMLDNLRDMGRKRAEYISKPEYAYMNQVSIVQSSGYGKSRMMDQMATVVFTIPFNLRSDKDTSREESLLVP